jgi:hypothetical protein
MLHLKLELIKLHPWKLKKFIKMDIYKLMENLDFKAPKQILGAIMFMLLMINIIIRQDFGSKVTISMAFLSPPSKYSKTSTPNTKTRQ